MKEILLNIKIKNKNSKCVCEKSSKKQQSALALFGTIGQMEYCKRFSFCEEVCGVYFRFV